MRKELETVILKKRNKLEKYLADNKIEAFRLVTRDSVTPVNVDIYLDNAVIHVFDQTNPEFISDLEEILSLHWQVKEFFYKDRSRTIQKLEPAHSKKIVINEYGHKFLVNLSDYLDTGLFLDLREMRRILGNASRGKTVLNTFAYSGSFTIYCAAGGAEKTYSVDISRVYCDWIKTNLDLNDLTAETNWISKMDTLDYFQYATKKGYKFDIIIIDPPTFSRYKGRSFSVQKDHPVLINQALKLLQPEGRILFSTNFSGFQLTRSALLSGQIERAQSYAPPDFEGADISQCYFITHPKRTIKSHREDQGSFQPKSF